MIEATGRPIRISACAAEITKFPYFLIYAQKECLIFLCNAPMFALLMSFSPFPAGRIADDRGWVGACAGRAAGTAVGALPGHGGLAGPGVPGGRRDCPGPQTAPLPGPGPVCPAPGGHSRYCPAGPIPGRRHQLPLPRSPRLR